MSQIGWINPHVRWIQLQQASCFFLTEFDTTPADGSGFGNFHKVPALQRSIEVEKAAGLSRFDKAIVPVDMLRSLTTRAGRDVKRVLSQARQLSQRRQLSQLSQTLARDMASPFTNASALEHPQGHTPPLQWLSNNSPSLSAV